MGAQSFEVEETGATVKEAFTKSVDAALWDHGHSGYTGTIAEKGEFIEYHLPDGVTAHQVLEALDSAWQDHGPMKKLLGDRIGESVIQTYEDKWGPAVALKVADDRWLFCGWASC